jgi:hypothetical protein
MGGSVTIESELPTGRNADGSIQVATFSYSGAWDKYQANLEEFCKDMRNWCGQIPAKLRTARSEDRLIQRPKFLSSDTEKQFQARMELQFNGGENPVEQIQADYRVGQNGDGSTQTVMFSYTGLQQHCSTCLEVFSQELASLSEQIEGTNDSERDDVPNKIAKTLVEKE